METIFMNTENNNTNESHTVAFILPHILHLRILNKHVVPQNLPIYYRWRNKTILQRQ